MLTVSAGDSGCDKSTPAISAPSAPAILIASIIGCGDLYRAILPGTSGRRAIGRGPGNFRAADSVLCAFPRRRAGLLHRRDAPRMPTTPPARALAAFP